MPAIYNELEPYPSQWLRNLVEAGHIATGAVDERDIREVQPTDVRDATQFHAFAGIGAWSHALRLAGWPDDVPVWTGSCPCQPFSSAGRRKGIEDERHLWPEWLRLITECRPAIIFGEQVASPDGRAWLDTVSADLEALGYAVGSADLCAASVGAPHIRQRLFFVAYTTDKRRTRFDALLQRQEFRRFAKDLPEASGGGAADELANTDNTGSQRRSVEGNGADQRASRSSGVVDDFWAGAEWITCEDGKGRSIEPGTQPLAHGITARVGRLRAYGNAIVPHVAATFITAFIESVMSTQDEIGELLCPEDYVFVSISQGDTWDDTDGRSGCNRKWGFDKINHVKRAKNPVLEFGKTGHKHAQAWISKGTPPPDTPEGNTFKLGIKKGWLPAPKTKDVYTEEVFTREMHEVADDLMFIGYIDVVDMRDLEHVIVTDHKFTKDLRYMMDEKELSVNIQSVGYARIIFDETEAQQVTARWIYYCATQPQIKEGQPVKPRKPKAAKKVEFTFHRGANFETQWQRVVEVFRGIYHAKNTVKEAHELDPNPRVCGAYGGCPFSKDDPKTGKPFCKIPDESRFRAHFAQFDKTNKKKGITNMGGLFDKISGKANKAAEADTPEPEDTATRNKPGDSATPLEGKNPMGGGGLVAKFNKLSSGSGKTVSLAGEAKVTPAAKAGGMNAAMNKKKNDGVNPPEQHEPDSGDDPTPETAVEKKKRVAKEKREAKKALKEAEEAAAEKTSAPGGAPSVVVNNVTTPGNKGMGVFIDCVSMKGNGEVIQLIDILAESMAVVAEKIGEPHWNLAEYGKGPSLLATVFDEWLDNNPVNAWVAVDSLSAESRAVREVLIAHANAVVRGVR